MIAKTGLAIVAFGCLLAAAPAQAQQTIAGMEIPAEEMDNVHNHCETLAAAERSEMGEAAQGQGDHEENPAAQGGTSENAAGQGNAEGNTALTEAEDAGAAAETAGAMDFDTITLEDCTEAGLTTAK